MSSYRCVYISTPEDLSLLLSIAGMLLSLQVFGSCIISKLSVGIYLVGVLGLRYSSNHVFLACKSLQNALICGLHTIPRERSLNLWLRNTSVSFEIVEVFLWLINRVKVLMQIWLISQLYRAIDKPKVPSVTSYIKFCFNFIIFSLIVFAQFIAPLDRVDDITLLVIIQLILQCGWLLNTLVEERLVWLGWGLRTAVVN